MNMSMNNECANYYNIRMRIMVLNNHALHHLNK